MSAAHSPTKAERHDDVRTDLQLQQRCNRQPYCELCGDPIRPTQSRVRPEATHCDACREAQSHR